MANAVRVERAGANVAELFEKLKRAQANELVTVGRISGKDLVALQAMAWRAGCKVTKIKGDGMRVSLVMKASRQAYVRTRTSALAVPAASQEGEAERFAASMERMCRERRVPVPPFSVMLGWIKELGYQFVPQATATR